MKISLSDVMIVTPRFCANTITLSVGGFYKAFGQSFIADDHFLSLVGAVSSIFNCSGRLFYGLLMDRQGQHIKHYRCTDEK